MRSRLELLSYDNFFVALVFAAPIVGVISPLGLAPLVAGSSVFLTLGYLRAHGKLPKIPVRLGIVLGALFALSVASTVWAIDSGSAAQSLVKSVTIMICGLLLFSTAFGQGSEYRTAFRKALIFGSFFSVAYLFMESAYIWIFRPNTWETQSVPDFLILNRPSVWFALTVWPLTAAISYSVGRRTAVVAWVLLLALAYFMRAHAATMAIAASGAVFVLAQTFPRIFPRVLWVAVLAATLATPFIAKSIGSGALKEIGGTSTARSVAHRLYIWEYAADRIAMKPYLGWGFRNSRHVVEATGVPQPDSQSGSELAEWIAKRPLPLHPHNSVLQVWLELGVFGAVVLSAFFHVVIRGIDRWWGTAREEKSISYGFFTAALVVACLSPGLWQNWWLSALWLACTTFILVVPAFRPDGNSA